jgi:hypothetical protein
MNSVISAKYTKIFIPKIDKTMIIKNQVVQLIPGLVDPVTEVELELEDPTLEVEEPVLGELNKLDKALLDFLDVEFFVIEFIGFIILFII